MDLAATDPLARSHALWRATDRPSRATTCPDRSRARRAGAPALVISVPFAPSGDGSELDRRSLGKCSAFLGRGTSIAEGLHRAFLHPATGRSRPARPRTPDQRPGRTNIRCARGPTGRIVRSGMVGQRDHGAASIPSAFRDIRDARITARRCTSRGWAECSVRRRRSRGAHCARRASRRRLAQRRSGVVGWRPRTVRPRRLRGINRGAHAAAQRSLRRRHA